MVNSQNQTIDSPGQSLLNRLQCKIEFLQAFLEHSRSFCNFTPYVYWIVLKVEANGTWFNDINHPFNSQNQTLGSHYSIDLNVKSNFFRPFRTPFYNFTLLSIHKSNYRQSLFNRLECKIEFFQIFLKETRLYYNSIYIEHYFIEYD